MKEYSTSQIRNVVLAGHSHSGKTSLVEAILYNLKLTERLGTVEEGNTVSDYDPEEIRRRTSLGSTLIPVEFRDHKINMLDIPGSRDFIGDIRNTVRVADAMIIFVDATSGVEIGTEQAFDLAEEFNLPRMFVINKINHEKANFDATLGQIETVLGCPVVLLNYPYGVGTEFKGCVNLLKMKLAKNGADGKVTYEDIPADLSDKSRELKAALIEAAAEGDDELTGKFLEGEELSHLEVLRGLKEDLLDHHICPVVTASATESTGCMSLLDFIIECFPAPGEEGPFRAEDRKTGKEIQLKYNEKMPAAAFVFKTISDPYAGHLSFFKVMNGSVCNDTLLLNTNRGVEERINHLQTMLGKKSDSVSCLNAGDIGVIAKLANTHTGDTLCDPKAPIRIDSTVMPSHVVHMAIRAANKDDEDRISVAMHRLMEQDPTLHLHRDTETHQTILSGMGDTHLDVAVARLKNQGKVEVELETPRVPYRETISRTAKGQGKHKKQSGGRGQYGDCWIRLEPLGEGGGFEFGWEVVGGVVPTKYQPSVEKGIVKAMERGIVSGHKAVDVRAICYDGSHHAVDSSDMAFQIAASKAFKAVAREAAPVITEPVYRVKVVVPEEYVGDVMGDLNSRRGRILGIDTRGRNQQVDAHVPLAELAEYARQLRSLSHGRGTFEAEYDHYEKVPAHIQEKLVSEAIQEADDE